MPHYVVSSETPLKVREVNVPDLPDWEAGQLPVFPERPGFPDRPGHGLPPALPPREEWPPLPPWLQPGVGLPIPPTVEHPWVPIPPGPDVDPPDIWPPMPGIPELPDLSGKTLVLARFYVSRHVNYLRWVVIDHAEAKGKIEKAIQWIKDHMPAGGVGGRPPPRPGGPGAPEVDPTRR
jgi:hypothetical protein